MEGTVGMQDTTLQTRQELVAIVDILSNLTGLSSRWNGEVELSQDPSALGRKPFTCRIVINRSLVNLPVRWRTLIHEALHSFSAGYNRDDYQSLRGWEEGVVEQLQRLLRPSVLTQLSIVADATIFQDAEEDYPFNEYIQVLEQLRIALGPQPIQDFYLTLLATEIKNRPGLILNKRIQLRQDKRYAFIRLFSRANSVLKERLL